MSGIVEIRGIVNKDGTLSYGEFTQYDNEFGKSNSLMTYEIQTLATMSRCLNTTMACAEICA